MSNDINDISKPVTKDNINPMEKALDEIGKKSKKKKIITITLVLVFVPVILGVVFQVINPMDISSTLIPTNLVTIDDFETELFYQGIDIICIKHSSISCLVKNDGRIILSLENGIYKFQTADYSLMKGHMSDIGYEEKSISYAFYENQVTIKQWGSDDFAMWLITPQDK